MARYSSLESVPVEDVVGSRDLFGYRNVAKLAVRARRGGGLRAGVYEPGSHRLAEASGCEVQQPAINQVLGACLEEASTLGIPPYDEESGTGELRYLVARYSAWRRRVLLVIVTAAGDAARFRELARRVARRSRAVGGIVRNENSERGNVILGRRWSTLRPPAELVERIGPFVLATSPGAFLQTNVWTARRIYETVLEWTVPAPDETAIDLYSGVGPLALYLATRARRVVGIEEVAAAVRDARANAQRNRAWNVRFETGTVEQVFSGPQSSARACTAPSAGVQGAIGEAQPRSGEQRTGPLDRWTRPAIVTMNPPRKGAAPEALGWIARSGPRAIAYVSCDPGTLARDLDRLADLGYRTTRLRPFDMMPQTPQVEVVALAERRPSVG